MRKKRKNVFSCAAAPKASIWLQVLTGENSLTKAMKLSSADMEHHANIIPWQILAEEKGAKLRVIPMNERGELIIEEYENMLNERTKIVSVSHVSNSLGNNQSGQGNDCRRRTNSACRFWLTGRSRFRIFRLMCRIWTVILYTFSGHKMFAPTGSGVLYGKHEFLDKMPPYQTRRLE